MQDLCIKTNIYYRKRVGFFYSCLNLTLVLPRQVLRTKCRMHPFHFLSSLNRRMPDRKGTRQTIRAYAHIFLRQEVSKKKKEKKKRRLHHPVICFALTSTQGVSSLPHSSTKSCHPAVPTITTAFFPMLFNFPFGTRPCVSHPTGLYLKASQRVEVGKAAACIPTAMTLPITLPQNSPGSCSTAGRLPAEPQSATSTITPWWHQDCHCTLQIFLLQSKKLLVQHYNNSPLPHIYQPKESTTKLNCRVKNTETNSGSC